MPNNHTPAAFACAEMNLPSSHALLLSQTGRLQRCSFILITPLLLPKLAQYWSTLYLVAFKPSLTWFLGHSRFIFTPQVHSTKILVAKQLPTCTKSFCTGWPWDSAIKPSTDQVFPDCSLCSFCHIYPQSQICLWFKSVHQKHFLHLLCSWQNFTSYVSSYQHQVHTPSTEWPERFSLLVPLYCNSVCWPVVGSGANSYSLPGQHLGSEPSAHTKRLQQDIVSAY